MTLHQGAIEDIFLDNMRDMGVEVSRPVIPTSLEVTEALVDDFDAYPVRVSPLPTKFFKVWFRAPILSGCIGA